MEYRDALDSVGNIVGKVGLSDGSTEDQWTAALAPYLLIVPKTVEQTLEYNIEKTVKDRRSFAEDLIEDFKQKNVKDGINAVQGFWLQHRMRSLEISFSGMNFTIDMMNLVVSGDAELACLALQYMVVDDMTQPYHWFSEARRNWLVSQLKTYLGWP